MPRVHKLQDHLSIICDEAINLCLHITKLGIHSRIEIIHRIHHQLLQFLYQPQIAHLHMQDALCGTRQAQSHCTSTF